MRSSHFSSTIALTTITLHPNPNNFDLNPSSAHRPPSIVHRPSSTVRRPHRLIPSLPHHLVYPRHSLSLSSSFPTLHHVDRHRPTTPSNFDNASPNIPPPANKNSP